MKEFFKKRASDHCGLFLEGLPLTKVPRREGAWRCQKQPLRELKQEELHGREEWSPADKSRKQWGLEELPRMWASCITWLSFHMTTTCQGCKELTQQCTWKYSAHYETFKSCWSLWSWIRMAHIQGSGWGRSLLGKAEMESGHRSIHYVLQNRPGTHIKDMEAGPFQIAPMAEVVLSWWSLRLIFNLLLLYAFYQLPQMLCRP